MVIAPTKRQVIESKTVSFTIPSSCKKKKSRKMKIFLQKLLKTGIEKMSPFRSEHILMKTKHIGISSEYVHENEGVRFCRRKAVMGVPGVFFLNTEPSNRFATCTRPVFGFTILNVQSSKAGSERREGASEKMKQFRTASN